MLPVFLKEKIHFFPEEMINPHRFVKKESRGQGGGVHTECYSMYMMHVNTVGLKPLVSHKK